MENILKKMISDGKEKGLSEDFILKKYLKLFIKNQLIIKKKF